MAHFVLSKKKVIEQYITIRKLCNRVTYSSKTNPIVSSILEETTDSFFSIHLKDELTNIQDMSRVQFLAQGWSKEVIQDLLSQGIRWFVVDNETDLDTLVAYMEKRTEKITLLLRLKLKENTIRTEKHYVFGMYSETIAKRTNDLKKAPFIKDIGIHFHRKTQNMSEWNILGELEETFDEDFFRTITVMNIGGGIPAAYANTNIKVFDNILKKIETLYAWCQKRSISMVIEPGRYISAPPGELHTTIISIHEDTIIVDASVYNGDLDALIVPVKLQVKGEIDYEEATKHSAKKYIIKGVTPCSLDIFRYRVFLEEKKIGDTLVFLNAGAYNFASDFCSQKPLKVLIK
ncbi:MAG: decarboxylase [Desulfobacteraceae bacterium]|nr:decarboxylase [Desulfobacteraceae bacterium]